MHGICQTYSSIWNDWFIRAKKTTELPSRVRTRMYRSLPMLGTWYHSSKCIFYSVWMSDRYIPGVYQVYTYHISYAAILRAFLVSQARSEGSYSFLIPFDSIVPVVRRPRSSKALKKTRLRAMSSAYLPWRPLVASGGRTVHVKKSCGRTIHMLSGSAINAATS
jgi:hypothetical protein